MTTDPIAADTPIESGPLVLYNWADYIYKKEVAEFEEKFGVEVEITTFNNMEEGIAEGRERSGRRPTSSSRPSATCAASCRTTCCSRCSTS